MIFHKTPLETARLIELEKRGDARGFFARFFCEKEFAAEGLTTRFVQVNNSLSAKKGTLRGMHYQLPPAAETKLVRCIRGAFWDVIVDLRPDSPSFGKWYGAELSAENRLMMYVPHGFAHGFITLTEDAEALYMVDAFYAPEGERGLRWNDPAIGIQWPIAPEEISDKDQKWPDLDAGFHGLERMRGLL
ncbi:dTDP-4-dehydrorhamnose 3,5-epimerase [Humitalea sp. 24SJ18S-53]|uniref:dTDP-4-dehydrorhamnose 3,5-epimerase n=1 Tax=Humitalea sp. 24SJ18S-53 TaxID=3422307 RepID=UPI003D6649F2